MARKVAMSPASSTPLSRSASSITTNFDDHSQSWSNNGAAYQPRPQAYEPSSRTNPRVNGIEYKSDLGPKRRLSRLKPDPLNISSKQRIFFEVAKSPYGIRSYSTEGCCWPKARNETESGVQEATNVLVSKRIIDLNRAHTVELHCLSETPEPLLSGNPQFRWLHMQSNPMDLEEFEKFALNSPGISGDLLDLCIALFDHIRENSLIKSGNSLQVEPGTVKQFRLQHADQIASESTSATFSSFPYLSTSAASPVKRHQDRRHRMRTLLEAFYQYESTCERDRKQALGKFFSNAGHKIIHVPQLWSLLLGSVLDHLLARFSQ
ncbi:hypothetical protein EJ05DRAFT_38665 [Pseudovirgaria hyperparasitica]|uniref:Uncharacterized protein n=1 Tax=Pseudovirgaria hyperparasitica TaxID=470096 RepID=A0A6A6WMK7_9PEZI|nr:uncharacterized protein EJ05DRAFT_38665 [Pseudovirgaria hyperparasitica]KAF2763435.1 hypothetical protein EJ05DRAFT_38665 [Pseudovirgaria hyperparasitica]